MLNIANGVSAFNYYMIFGGTNWGWTGSPHAGFTSYDYGAGITEDRLLTAKLAAQKEIGYFQEAVPSIAASDPLPAPRTKVEPGWAPVKSYQRVAIDPTDSVTGTGVRLLGFRHLSSNEKRQTRFTTALTIPQPGGDLVFDRVPQQSGTFLTLHGRDALMLVANQKLGETDLMYSTSQVFANERLAAGHFAVVTGTRGDAGETVLRFKAAPRVLAGQGVDTTWDSARGLLRLNYSHGDPRTVTVIDGDRRLQLRIVSRDSLERAWVLRGPGHSAGGNAALYAEGPDLVRTVTYDGDTAHVTGSQSGEGTATFWLPPGITRATWNGGPAVAGDVSGVVTLDLPGPAPVDVPTLRWKAQVESPEAAVGYDDSGWTLADARSSENRRHGPGLVQRVVLDANYYGFHEGDIWYRAHYVANLSDPVLSLTGFGGEASSMLVWVNGHYAGAYPANKVPQLVSSPRGSVRAGQPVVLSVLLRNQGQRVDWQSFGESQHQMGLWDATLISRGPVMWRIQGAVGAEEPADAARTLYNNGGLTGERSGWYLPGFDDEQWKAADDLRAERPGVTWYRSHFDLDVPRGQDVAFKLDVESERFATRSDRARTVMFVNGWNVGTWVGSVGPQSSFTIPSGFLNMNGANTVAIAVTAEASGMGPDAVTLRQVSNQTGGMRAVANQAPDYAELAPKLAAQARAKPRVHR